MCFQIWQTDKERQKRILWGFLSSLSETIEIVQMMVDGMRDDWTDEFEIIVSDQHIPMAAFIAEHGIKKCGFYERMN